MLHKVRYGILNGKQFIYRVDNLFVIENGNPKIKITWKDSGTECTINVLKEKIQWLSDGWIEDDENKPIADDKSKDDVISELKKTNDSLVNQNARLKAMLREYMITKDGGAYILPRNYYTISKSSDF